MSKILVFAIALLFTVLSIVPVNSLNVEKIDVESNESTAKSVEEPSFPMSYDCVHNLNLGEGLLDSYDYYRDLYEKHLYRSRHYIRNDSDYSFDESFFDYPEYDKFRDIYRQRFDDEYVKNHTLKDRKPTPKPNFADGKTWYVDDDGGADFTKIQDAIDNASNGDTIFVYSGIYYENLNINKSIILLGEDKNSTIIHFSGYGTFFNVINDWVTITNFTMQSDRPVNEYKGSYIYSNNVYISRNIISKICIIFYGTNNNTFEKNEMYSEFSLLLLGSCNNYILNNYVKSRVSAIIYIYNSHDNKISNNIINYNYSFSHPSNIPPPIHLEESDKNIINNNIFRANTNGSFANFGVLLSNDNRITDNNFYNFGLTVIGGKNIVENNFVNGKPLVYLDGKSNYDVHYAGQIILIDCDNITIKSQEISNTSCGIFLWNTSDCKIYNCRIANNMIGIWLLGGKNNNIEDNSFVSNYYMGLMNQGFNTIISDNVFISNMIGLVHYSSSECIITYNKFFNDGLIVQTVSPNIIQFFDNEVNSKPLVFLYNKSGEIVKNAGQVILIKCDNITIQNQNISNTAIGIYLSEAHDCNISDNVISSNHDYGIEFDDCCDNNIIFNNTICFNNYGIYFRFLCRNNMISHNTISSNAENGIYAGGYHNTIRYNVINSNNGNGIAIDDSYHNISNNIIQYNKYNGIYIYGDVYGGYVQLINNNCIANTRDGIHIEDSSNNMIANCTIQNHIAMSGIFLKNSPNTVIEDCNIQQNWRGIQIDSDSSSNRIESCLVINNYWGIKLAESENNTIEDCTISNNVGGIIRGINSNIFENDFEQNSIGILWGYNKSVQKNNFVNNKIFHASGKLFDKNVFRENYWSDRRINLPLPYHVYGLNIDWFPKATPYDYSTSYGALEDYNDNKWWNWDNLTLHERDVEKLDYRFYMRDRNEDLLENDFQRPRYWSDENVTYYLDARDHLMDLRGEIN